MGRVARHPKYLLDELSVEEFEDWKACFQLYPFGEDVLMGMIARLHADVINIQMTSDATPINAKDLMPGSDFESRWERIEEMIEEEREERRLERLEQLRLAKLSPEEREAELQRRFIAARQAELGD
jgi:hypothetical protein